MSALLGPVVASRRAEREPNVPTPERANRPTAQAGRRMPSPQPGRTMTSSNQHINSSRLGATYRNSWLSLPIEGPGSFHYRSPHPDRDIPSAAPIRFPSRQFLKQLLDSLFQSPFHLSSRTYLFAYLASHQVFSLGRNSLPPPDWGCIPKQPLTSRADRQTVVRQGLRARRLHLLSAPFQGTWARSAIRGTPRLHPDAEGDSELRPGSPA
ncbi:hypothetical protein HKD37_U057976 [Glycine soja]